MSLGMSLNSEQLKASDETFLSAGVCPGDDLDQLWQLY